jgi:signal transduction histidine kinase
LETKRPQQIEFFEPRFKSYLEVSVSPIFDEKGEIMATVHITKDITKRKKAEQKLADAYQELKDTQEQLIQSSKMAAMGQLAAGISHELNQPLTGIKGFAQAVHMDMEEDNPLKEDINKIIEQADRMDRIIKNIRLFARKSEFEMQEIDINQPIESAVMLMSEQLKVHNILLKKQLDENLPKIEGDLNQFQQVFLNLITNARDAIDSLKRPDGGELTIKTCLNEDKKNIEIYFQDTGCGIPSEHLENIFNPFFTTKSPDGGIGLGLSIAYRSIENHKGRIEVRSKVGEGTTFKIIIPVNRVKT